MPESFYYTREYRQKQSLITHQNWLLGKYASLIKHPTFTKRKCKNPDCRKVFSVLINNPKKYCSWSCAAHINNHNRKLSVETRQKISTWMKNHSVLFPSPLRKRRVKVICKNPSCHKEIFVLPYLVKVRKYCSNACAMKVIGGQTTSPKASQGKPGIRPDIDSQICFYSTWEANIARVFNLVNLKWQYAPKTFDLGKHTYRPDFYLPDYDTFIEVKNFMNPYSQERDRLFREKFPQLKLDLIQKTDYIKIKDEYQPMINNWE